MVSVPVSIPLVLSIGASIISFLIPVGTIPLFCVNECFEPSILIYIEAAVSIPEIAVCKTKSQTMETKAYLCAPLYVWLLHVANISGVEKVL